MKDKKQVSLHLTLNEDDNFILQGLADSENISKKALIQNIISNYLKERKVAELLPTFLEDVHQWSDYLNDLKIVMISNSKILKQNSILLHEMAGLDGDLDGEVTSLLKENGDQDE